MSTPHVIASSSGHPFPSLSNNGIVGGHYKVGKKIGEGSFGVVYEGWSPFSPFIQCVLVVIELLLSVFIGRRSVMRFHFSDSRPLLLCVPSLLLMALFATVNLSHTIRQASKSLQTSL